MLILAQSLHHRPIIAPGTTKLGELGEPVVDPSNGRILAFRVLPTGWLRPIRLVAASDILALDERIVIINNPESIVPAAEIVRAHKSLRYKIRALGTRAWTENGTYLGHIYDLLINTEPPMIVRYYIRYFTKNRILPAEKVVRITPRGVIFSDDVTNPTIAAQSAPA